MLWRSGLALIALTGWSHAAELELVARLPMVSDHPHFGGASGIQVMGGGTYAFVLTDRGRVFEMMTARDKGDLVEPVLKAGFFSWFGGDSEGLAVRPDRYMYVSYEWPARVDRPWKYCLPSHDAFGDMPGNRALEALALDASGRLYAIAENPRAGAEVRAIYRFDSGRWDVARQLASDRDYKPVGADIGPDGLLYVLERRLGLWGFQSQIRRMEADTEAAAEVIWQSVAAEFDNLEGLSVWKDSEGATRLTMVSDDNFQPFLRGELVEFLLKE